MKMFKKFLQDLEKKRNDMVLLCVELQNYFPSYQNFNHLMQTILNIFFCLFLFLSNIICFFLVLIEDNRVDFSFFKNLLIDIVLFLASFFMSLTMLATTFVTLPWNAFKAYLEESKEVSSQSYSQMLKQLFEQKPIQHQSSVQKLIKIKFAESKAFNEEMIADHQAIEIQIRELEQTVDRIYNLLNKNYSHDLGQKKVLNTSFDKTNFSQLYSDCLKLRNNYPQWEELPDNIIRTNPQYFLERITTDLDGLKRHHVKVIDRAQAFLEPYQQKVNQLICEAKPILQEKFLENFSCKLCP